jgi:hypothetical protein
VQAVTSLDCLSARIPNRTADTTYRLAIHGRFCVETVSVSVEASTGIALDSECPLSVNITGKRLLEALRYKPELRGFEFQ